MSRRPLEQPSASFLPGLDRRFGFLLRDLGTGIVEDAPGVFARLKYAEHENWVEGSDDRSLGGQVVDPALEL